MKPRIFLQQEYSLKYKTTETSDPLFILVHTKIVFNKDTETDPSELQETQIFFRKFVSLILSLTASTVNSHQHNILSHYSLLHSLRQNELFSLKD